MTKKLEFDLVLIDSKGNPSKKLKVSGDGPDIEERVGRVLQKIKEIQERAGWTPEDLESFARKMKQ